MTILDRITTSIGLGVFYGVRFEWLHKSFNNVTLGIHSQEWNAECEYDGTQYNLNEVHLGLLFFRFIFEFITPND